MYGVQPGQTLGPYRIVEQVGQGGMAAVFKAYHQAMNRTVALKVLPRHFAEDPEFTGRFRQEATVVANLEHPHILPVYDYGQSDGFTFLVMRFMDGGTLRERISQAPSGLPLAEAGRYFSHLADALDYAHGQGVIHRDVKPANVLIDARGSAFLTDFGIARLIESTSRFTGTGALLGTPVYMSPEQGRGQKVDRRSDIYSLGIILYEMVTGRAPFRAETPAALVFMHVYEPLPPPSALRPELPPKMEQALAKALAKDPADRFDSAADFLSAWLAAGPVPAGTAAPPAITSTVPGRPHEATEVAAPPARLPRPAPVAAATPALTEVAPPPLAAPPPSVAAGAQAAHPAQAESAVTAGPEEREQHLGPREQGRGKRRPRRLAWLLAGGTLAACVAIIALGYLISRALGPLLGQATPVAGANGDQGESSLEATDAPSAPLADSGSWTSWAAMNYVKQLAVHGDALVTGGLGGVAIWERGTGALQQTFTVNDGVPGPEVVALWVDDDGTIWAGAEGGLGRYDPTAGEWRIFRDEEGLDSRQITALRRLSDGRLLVGTRYGQGLNVSDGDRFTPFEGYPTGEEGLGDEVYALYEDAAGRLLVGANGGLGVFDGRDWSLYDSGDGLPADRVTAVLVAADGTVWSGTEAGLAVLNGDRFEAVSELGDNAIHGLLEDSQGRIWVTGQQPNLAMFDPAGGAWTFGEGSYWFGPVEDRDGRVYFGGDGEGVWLFDGHEYIAWRVANVPNQCCYQRILAAPDGTLWFSEHGLRTDRFDPQTETWEAVEGLPCCPLPLAFDGDGVLWAGDYESLWRIAPGEQRSLTTAEGVPEESGVRDIAFYPGGDFSAATDGGWALGNEHGVNLVRTAEDGSGMPSNRLRSVLVDSAGYSWLGSDGGLTRLSPEHEWTHWQVGDPFGEGFEEVADLEEGLDGSIWAATTGDGIYRIQGDTLERFAHDDPAVGLPTDRAICAAVAPNGDVWFCLQYYGAARYDGQGWTLYKHDVGLLDDDVRDIYVDAEGTVWFATGRGVSGWRP